MSDPTPTFHSPGTDSDGPPGSFATGPPEPPGFDLLDEVGRGGMGVIYRARDRSLNREVAVKVLNERHAPDSPTAGRFLEEARITAQLQHPGIPAVYQVGRTADGRPFLAMKLIRGDTLEAAVRAGKPIDPLAVIEAIGQAVGYAHAHGVIHRDLKPQNVMVGPFGEVQVMDWGLAKVLASDDPPPPPPDASDPLAGHTDVVTARDSVTPFTQYGTVLGTPAYIAPEQAAGELDKIDARSDVFGLGAVLCVLLTGRPPFDGPTAEGVRINAVRGNTEAAVARLAACRAAPDVVALCRRCLAFDPADRPADGHAVAAEVSALRRAADDRARQAERDRLAAEVRAAEQVKRRRAAQRAAGVVAAVLLAGVLGTSVGMYQADQARQRAATAERSATERLIEMTASAAAEKKAREAAVARQAEAAAVVRFFDDKVFAAAQPKGQEGGLGWNVTLRDAITASLPALAAGFADQPLVEARLRLSLGRTFFNLGESKAALEQFERARVLFAQLRGRDDPDSLASIDDLANSYALLGHHPIIRPMREETLAARRRVLPPNHPHTLASMMALASSYAIDDRHPEALKLREEALAGRRKVLPPNDPDTLASAAALASSYAIARRHPEALKLREEALAGRRTALPPNHPETLSSMVALATSYAQAGRLPDALALRQEALAARRRVLPPGHPHTLASMTSVADTLVKLGRGADAVPLIDECVPLAAGKDVPLRVAATALDLRLRHFQGCGDPAGCRATAAMWEQLKRSDAGSLYTAARMRGVAAGVCRKAGRAAEATADADRAMDWLTRAVAAGYADRDRIETDADLTALHGRPDFRAVVAVLPYLAPRPRPAE